MSTHPARAAPTPPGSVLSHLAHPDGDGDGDGDGDVLLLTKEVTTNAQGFFDERITVPWDKLVSGLRRAGADLARLASVQVRAEMVPLPLEPAAQLSSAEPPQPQPQPQSHPTQLSPPLAYPIPPAPSLRVISDIDDTVKHTGVLLGAKQVFHNVFVRHLDELVLDGVAQWYREMEAWGLGFHYVVRAPWALL
ncbi:hypothetical protein CALCODRAFT_498822 [Calocera cornea HHB12733]|uniref:Phosphatidate phosphatase APP1 catalytic domain-containing protein n=1 Tax=Calocera cornea HHB12733 TaxID=1353952 RepID=A0A165ENP8_9BASI|nr:hypothetical protein CALCODRAFT_498822 [Calocera cornea HHB12733]